MIQLDYFKKFVAPNEQISNSNYEVWSYTRVSSKEQFEQNSSVERQKDANRNYASKHDFKIIEEFGGTYESAKSDFTRKEFSRLIEKVKKSRKKPYAILVYKMSRFSRSGGNAIGLVSYLVDELKVHLIEVSTGLNSTTDRGKAAIWESLFHAFRENLERKEIIIPNMKAYVNAGNWFSRAPMGYDHYGPRVKDGKFLSKKQRIVINETGKLLKHAWKWKLSGLYSDVQIMAKLAHRGLHVDAKKLSPMWRNPFYCGINTNKLVDEPVKGHWECIVSVDDFIKVQQILQANPSGYQHKKEVEERPLTRLLRCNLCDCFMVGYKNNQKDLHYYRCLNCNGVSLCAKTSPTSRKKSAEELFSELMHMYQIPNHIIPLMEIQLTKLFKNYNEVNLIDEKQLEKQEIAIQNQLKQLKIRFGLGNIDKETFELTNQHLLEQRLEINKELNNGKVTISNLENLLSKALTKLANLNVVWTSTDLEGKRAMHKIMFPEGIFYDAQNHQYLTRKTNQFVALVSSLIPCYEQNKNRKFQNFIEKSGPVSGLDKQQYQVQHLSALLLHCCNVHYRLCPFLLCGRNWFRHLGWCQTNRN